MGTATQERAKAVGAALHDVAKLPAHPPIKATSVKAGVGVKVNITGTDHVASMFHGLVNIRFNHSLVPGKLVIEIWESPEGRYSWTPLSTGQKRLQAVPAKVEGLGKDAKIFGVTPAESVVMGRDKVLRVTMPKALTPLTPHKKRKFQAKEVPMTRVAETKAVESKPEPVKTETPVKIETPVARGPVRMKTRMSHSVSGVRLRIPEDELEPFRSKYFSVDEIRYERNGSDTVTFVLTTVDGHFKLGRPQPKSTDRVLTVGGEMPNRRGVPLFGPTYVKSITVRNKDVIVVVEAPFEPQGSRANKRIQRKPETAPVIPDVPVVRLAETPTQTPPERVTPAVGIGGAPLPPPVGEEILLFRLKREIAALNDTMALIREDGDDVSIRFEDGKVKARYESDV